MKKEEGITLVALIITIIILIILAAITLQTVVVDGILNLASQGSINYSQAQSNEVSMLDEMNGKLNDVTSTLGDGNGDSEAGKDDPNSVYNVLKVGDYVEYYYKSEKDPILCKVLYDREFNEKNSTKYGIQIVSIENDLDTVTLGYEDPRIETDAPEDVKNAPKDTDEGKLTRAIWSYNNAIETLNKAGEKYLSSNVKSVRCLGTIPDAPNTDVGYFTSDKDWFNEKYKNTIKGEEVSSDFGKSVMESRDDYTQLKVANGYPASLVPNNVYWFAVRRVTEDKWGNAIDYPFSVRTYYWNNDDETWFHDRMDVLVVLGDETESYSKSEGYFAGGKVQYVFTLDGEYSLEGEETVVGNGTKETPYKIK